MLKLMYESDGIGLAAPQIGINKRIMVFKEPDYYDSDEEYSEISSPRRTSEEMVLINPKIVSSSEETISSEEGCLSFPDIHGDVERPRRIEVEYQTLVGKVELCIMEDIPAIIFQHEYDHLNKVLFIDRFNQEDKENNARKLEKLVKRYGSGGAL
jgi:peptide deformylase